MAVKFFISVVCHNSVQFTQLCMESVLRYSEDFYLLITDNNSTDGTDRYLLDTKNEHCEIITNDSNEGFSKPQNFAYEVAKYMKAPYFVVINNDIEVSPNWLIEMEKAFKDPKVALVGVHGTCSAITRDGVGIESTTLEYIEASCMMVKTALVEELFSTEYKFAYYEDSDLSLRMRRDGFKIATVKLPIIHYRAKTGEHVKEDLEGFKLRNRTVFMNKWKGYLNTRDFRYNGTAKPERILVKRAGAIGDVILTTPVIRALKQAHNCDIDVQTQCPDVFDGNPDVSNCGPKAGEGISDYSYNHYSHHLGGGAYDQVIDLNLAYERSPDEHIVAAYAKAARVGISDHLYRPQLYNTQPYHVQGPYVVIHPGVTGWRGRNWDASKFSLIASRLMKKMNVVLVGDSATPSIPCHLDLRAKLDFGKLKGLISGASLFIGIDSMPMHVAQAFDIPAVVVFGCVLPQYRLIPGGKAVGVSLSELGCIGCHHWQSAPRTHSDCLRERVMCMEDLSVETVWDQVEQSIKVFEIKSTTYE